MKQKLNFTAEKIFDIAKTDCTGGLLDPENRRGPEVHPDLIRFKDWFYCIFNIPGGKRILRSPDGKTWETIQVGRAGQMFAITPWNELMTVGTSRIHDQKSDGTNYRQSFTKFTIDGVDWGMNYYCPASYDCVMYTVTWHKNTAYTVAYSGKDETGTLYQSKDGRDWQEVKKDLFPEGRDGNEGDLIFEENDNAYCLLRGPYGTPVTIGYGKAPDYQNWTWKVPEIDWYGNGKTLCADKAIRAPFGGPKFLRLNDGRLIAYGRVLGPDPGSPRLPMPENKEVAGGDKNDPLRRDENAVVTLMEFDPDKARLTRLMDFPEYTHYHGIVEHDGMLWIACGRCDSAWEVWLLKVKVPD